MKKKQSSNASGASDASTPAKRREAARASKQVLDQWNRVDTEDQEKLRTFRPKSSNDLVNKALEILRLDQRSSETQILKAWNHLIDPTLTAHAQPVGIRKGTLFVHVDNSVWLSEIVRYRREEILERLQTCFGKEMIQRISYRIG